MFRKIVSKDTWVKEKKTISKPDILKARTFSLQIALYSMLLLLLLRPAANLATLG
jgi:hypothetical protein